MMKKGKQITIILVTICLLIGNVLSIFLVRRSAHAEVREVGKSMLIMEQNEVTVKMIALKYCDLYQKSFVDMEPADMSDIVKETPDTFLTLKQNLPGSQKSADCP